MENQLSYEVSDKDLKNRIHSPFKLVLYPDLSNYQNITDILPNEFSILIILLEAGSGNHWTCLIRRNNILTKKLTLPRSIAALFFILNLQLIG